MNDKTLLDLFVDGARKGWTVGINSILPNLVMAFALMQILTITGAMKLIGSVFGPMMGIFGLPGEAVTVLLTSWLSMAGGVGVAASLFSQSLLNNTHVSILMPAIYLMGAQVQYMGRLLGVSETPKRWWPILFANSIICALISMVIMRIFL
jgi:spore maturation protein SpmB